MAAVFSIDELNEILKPFKSASGTTSKELAETAGVSRATAYAYIKAVKAAGVELNVVEEKTGHRGPPVKRYRCDPSVKLIEAAE